MQIIESLLQPVTEAQHHCHIARQWIRCLFINCVSNIHSGQQGTYMMVTLLEYWSNGDNIRLQCCGSCVDCDKFSGNATEQCLAPAVCDTCL